MCLGGDHSQATYMFVEIMLIRCNSEKVAHRIEIPIGEINEEKDKMECLTPLMSKICFGLDSLNMNEDGNAHMSIDNFNNVSFLSNRLVNANHNTCLMKFYIIGDLKGMFQLLGRNGHDSSYCLWCKCRPKEWKKHYLNYNSYLNKDKWTLESITSTAIDQEQKTSSGMSFQSVGIRSMPLLTCVPVIRALPPILHVFLGLGNDLCSKFKDCVQIRIEQITQGEIEALNMSLIAQIKHDDLLIANDDLSTQLSECTQQRINLNARLKVKLYLVKIKIL